MNSRLSWTKNKQQNMAEGKSRGEKTRNEVKKTVEG